MTLSQLCVKQSELGRDPGRCYLCGLQTETGFREPPSDAFTAWGSCFGGDVLCPPCRAMLHDTRFRRYSWLATSDELRLAQKGDRKWVWPELFEPHPIPFAWYFTRGGQKQSWLTLLPYLSNSPNRFYVGTDWTDRPVQIDRSWALGLRPTVEALRAIKIPKAALLDGQFSPHHYRRAAEAAALKHFEIARRLVGDPRWEVLIYAAP